MAHFPCFVDLRGQLVFLVGEDAAKLRWLLEFGAQVEQLKELTAEDLNRNPKLVVLAGGDRREMAALCRERNIPVNSVDDPENCSWFFPSIIRRGDLTVAISSGGGAPAASKALRRRLEDALPENLEAILPWLREQTMALRLSVSDYDTRAKLLGAITEAAFQKGRPLTEPELKELNL